MLLTVCCSLTSIAAKIVHEMSIIMFTNAADINTHFLVVLNVYFRVCGVFVCRNVARCAPMFIACTLHSHHKEETKRQVRG